LEFKHEDEILDYNLDLTIQKGLNRKLERFVKCNSSTRFDIITDKLLKYEMFASELSDSDREILLDEVYDVIRMMPKVKDYNYVALMAMFAGDYKNIDNSVSDEYKKLAVEIFEEAENRSLDQADEKNGAYGRKTADNNNEAAINNIAKRYWAASQLYKLTGDKKYKRIVEEIAIKDIPIGLSEDNPGYFGSIAYLTTTNKTDISINESMIKSLFDRAIEIINLNLDEEFSRLNEMSSDEKVDTVFENLKILVIANSISRSVDYTDRCSFYLSYLCGMNPEEIAYLNETESVEEIAFVLKGLEIFYETKQAE